MQLDVFIRDLPQLNWRANQRVIPKTLKTSSRSKEMRSVADCGQQNHFWIQWQSADNLWNTRDIIRGLFQFSSLHTCLWCATTFWLQRLPLSQPSQGQGFDLSITSEFVKSEEWQAPIAAGTAGTPETAEASLEGWTSRRKAESLTGSSTSFPKGQKTMSVTPPKRIVSSELARTPSAELVQNT